MTTPTRPAAKGTLNPRYPVHLQIIRRFEDELFGEIRTGAIAEGMSFNEQIQPGTAPILQWIGTEIGLGGQMSFLGYRGCGSDDPVDKIFSIFLIQPSRHWKESARVVGLVRESAHPIERCVSFGIEICFDRVERRPRKVCYIKICTPKAYSNKLSLREIAVMAIRSRERNSVNFCIFKYCARYSCSSYQDAVQLCESKVRISHFCFIEVCVFDNRTCEVCIIPGRSNKGCSLETRQTEVCTVNLRTVENRATKISATERSAGYIRATKVHAPEKNRLTFDHREVDICEWNSIFPALRPTFVFAGYNNSSPKAGELSVTVSNAVVEFDSGPIKAAIARIQVFQAFDFSAVPRGRHRDYLPSLSNSLALSFLKLKIKQHNGDKKPNQSECLQPYNQRGTAKVIGVAPKTRLFGGLERFISQHGLYYHTLKFSAFLCLRQVFVKLFFVKHSQAHNTARLQMGVFP
nr:hypothetical protein [Roseibium aggregatum]